MLYRVDGARDGQVNVRYICQESLQISVVEAYKPYLRQATLGDDLSMFKINSIFRYSEKKYAIILIYKIFSYERVKLKAETMDHNPVNINQTKFIFDKNKNKSVPRLF